MAGHRPIRRLFASLRGQMLMAVVGIHLLITPLFFVALIFFVTQAFTEQFVNQVRTHTRFLTTLVSERSSTEALEQMFYEAQLSGPLIYTSLLDSDGQLIWTMSDPLTDPQLPDFQEDFFFGQHDDGVYFISSPILDNGPMPARQLRLGFDETLTQEQIWSLYVRSGAVISAYMVLMLVFTAFWLYRLNRPLRTLRMESRRVADGDVRDPIDVHSGLDEIRELANDINHMRAELLKKSDQMEHLAMHDALTGLPNRALLMDRVGQSLKRAERAGEKVALLLMDLDHFKEINDTLGHSVGDRILCMLPERLEPCLREVDTIARLGGDEFAFLLPDTDVTGAVNVVHRIVDSMHRPFQLEGHNLHLGLSVGIAIFPDHGRDFGTLLREVDIAMYAAKQEKREYLVYNHTIDPHSRDRLELASELRRDIAAGKLQVHYQPQIRLKDGSPFAVEALCRWHHGARGEVATDDFIPLADRLGLMDALGRAVIQRAVRDFAGTPELEGMMLCVNLSAGNLHDPDLPDYLGEVLKDSGVGAESIILEITEHEYMEEPREALRQLAAFRNMGCGIAIDDFGTGHSSFTYLKHLPATEIKVDKSFVMDMIRDRHDYSIVAAIISLSQKLGLSVVAEGVQNQATLEALQELHCQRAQGFHIARPMPIEELAAYRRRHTMAERT